MTIFNYMSVDYQGKTRKGVLEGDSYQHIRQQLRNMNLIPIEISSEEKKRISLDISFNFRRKSISPSNLALITYQFGILLSVGFPIDMALLKISEQLEKKSIKISLLKIRSKVLEGQSLSTSLNEFPNLFPKVYRETIAAGEKSGQLENLVVRLSRYLEQQENIRQKIQQAMIYPALLTIVSISIIAFLLAYAMPKIISVFEESGQSLPNITLFLLYISNILSLYWRHILICIFLLIFSIKYLLKIFQFRYYLHVVFSKIPILNKTISTINETRFVRTFGILFTAGLPVLDAMQSANNTVTFIPMKLAIEKAIMDVVEGVSINHALSMTNYFNKLSTQLISSGEASGKLGIILEKTADYQDQNLSKWLTTALSLFEPLIIVFMGGIVLFIALAILLPIFQMNQFLG